MTSATFLPRGLGEESTTASENFPRSTARIRDASARDQLDSPLPGAVYHSSFVSRRHQPGAVLLLNNCGPEYGGVPVHPALKIPETPCQFWTPSAVHVGYVSPLANRSLGIALSAPIPAVVFSCPNELRIEQMATTAICRCPTSREVSREATCVAETPAECCEGPRVRFRCSTKTQ